MESVKEPKRTPIERVYDALTKRLEPFARQLSAEQQTELDGDCVDVLRGCNGRNQDASVFREALNIRDGVRGPQWREDA